MTVGACTSDRWSRLGFTVGLAILFWCSALATAWGGENTRKILIVGDSLMRTVSRAFEKQMAGVEGLEPVSLVSLGSGLARLDMYDWHAKLKEMAEQSHPAGAVVFMGANDNQPMKTEAGIAQPETPEWNAEYARRLGRAMDIMMDGGVKRIYWIGLPDMRDAQLQKHAENTRKIVAQESATRPGVTIVESAPMFSRKPGEFSTYILQANGLPLQVRDGDGVHLTRGGADLLVARIIPLLQKEFSAAP